MLEQIAADGSADGLAHLALVLPPPGRHAVHGVLGDVPQLLQKLLGFLDIYKAPGDDLRLAQQPMVVGGHGQHDDHHAVLGQELPVVEDHGPHIAHAGAVHKHLSGGNGRLALHVLGGQLDNGAVFSHADAVGIHAHGLRHPLVDLQHPLLAVQRDEEPGLGQGVDDLQLLLAGVAGHMQHVRLVIHHVGPLAEQLVDDPAHRHLIAGNGGGGNNDLVLGADVDLLMGGEGHAVQGAHFLALAAGGDDDLLLGRQALDAVDVHHRALGQLHIPQLRGHLHDVLHAAAGDGHLPPAGGGGVDDLLDAVDIAGEGGDDNALFAPSELPDKRLAHGALAHGIARALHVGGVRQQGQDTLLAQGAEPGQVDDLPVDGSGVDLEVSGVDHGAHAGMDGEGHGVGDGVVHMDELHLELAGLHGLACLHRHQLGAVQQPVLLELQLDESGGEAGAVNGHVDLLEHIGDGPNVILVAVGDEQAPQPGLVFHQIRHIGDDAVDAVHVVAGEGHAAVHHDDLAAVLIGGHVLADLIQTAQRDDFQFFCHIFCKFSFIVGCSPHGTRRKMGAEKPGRTRPPAGPASPPESGNRARLPCGSRGKHGEGVDLRRIPVIHERMGPLAPRSIQTVRGYSTAYT